jgi:hypothetical protein
MIDRVGIYLFPEGAGEELMAETSTVTGIFADHRLAEQAILDLKRAGFGDDQLGFVVRRPWISLQLHQGLPGPVSVVLHQ